MTNQGKMIALTDLGARGLPPCQLFSVDAIAGFSRDATGNPYVTVHLIRQGEIRECLVSESIADINERLTANDLPTLVKFRDEHRTGRDHYVCRWQLTGVSWSRIEEQQFPGERRVTVNVAGGRWVFPAKSNSVIGIAAKLESIGMLDPKSREAFEAQMRSPEAAGQVIT